MFQVTCIHTDGTERAVLLAPAAVMEADGDIRPGSRSKTVITKVDGRKLFIKETLAEITPHLMPTPAGGTGGNTK